MTNCGSDGYGLHPWHTAIAWSIVAPSDCPSWDPNCVALDGFVPWGVMELKKFMIVLYWYALVGVGCIIVLPTVSLVFGLCTPLQKSKNSPNVWVSKWSDKNPSQWVI